MSSSSLESIRNYVRLRPDIGTAGQPTREQFDAIAAAGFEVVINLALPDHPDSLDDEGSLVTRLGLSYFHLPVPFDAPAADHVRDFCRLLRCLRGRRLFVHCIMNYRVAAFMYHYLRLVEGCDESAARSPMLDRWQIEPQWQRILDLPPRTFAP